MREQNFTGYQAVIEEFQKHLNDIQGKLGLQPSRNDENSTNNLITNGLHGALNTTVKVTGTVGSSILGLFNATRNATESSNEWQLNTNGTNTFNGTDLSTEGNTNEENSISLYYVIAGIAAPILIGGLVTCVYLRSRFKKNIKQNPTNGRGPVYLQNPIYDVENQERTQPLIVKPAKSLIRYRMIDANGYNIPPPPLPFGPGNPRDVENYKFIEMKMLPSLPRTIPSEDEVQNVEEHTYESVIYKEVSTSNDPEKVGPTYGNTNQTWYDSPKGTKQAISPDSNGRLKDIVQGSDVIPIGSQPTTSSTSNDPEKVGPMYGNTNSTLNSLQDTNQATSSDSNGTLENIDQGSNVISKLTQDLNSMGNTTDHVSKIPTTDDYQRNTFRSIYRRCGS